MLFKNLILITFIYSLCYSSKDLFFVNKNNFESKDDILWYIQSYIDKLNEEEINLKNYFKTNEKLFSLLSKTKEDNEKIFNKLSLFSFLEIVEESFSMFDSNKKNSLTIKFLKLIDNKNYFSIDKEQIGFNDVFFQLNSKYYLLKKKFEKLINNFLEENDYSKNLSIVKENCIKFLNLESKNSRINYAKNFKLFLSLNNNSEKKIMVNDKINTNKYFKILKNNNFIIENTEQFISKLNKLKVDSKKDYVDNENLFKLLKEYKNKNTEFFNTHFMLYNLKTNINFIGDLKTNLKDLFIYEYLKKFKLNDIYQNNSIKNSYENFQKILTERLNKYDNLMFANLEDFVKENNLNKEKVIENIDIFLLNEYFDERILKLNEFVEFSKNFNKNLSSMDFDILNTSMKDSMINDVFDIAYNAYYYYDNNTEIARYIKSEMEVLYTGYWTCSVGQVYSILFTPVKKESIIFALDEIDMIVLFRSA